MGEKFRPPIISGEKLTASGSIKTDGVIFPPYFNLDMNETCIIEIPRGVSEEQAIKENNEALQEMAELRGILLELPRIKKRFGLQNPNRTVRQR